jgi:ABC-type phosphate transport system substrate-binding protein
MRIARILLSAYLRRHPTHIRLSQFNFLSRYVWLKDLLNEIRPELFPPEPETERLEAVEPEAPGEEVAKLLKAEIRGRRGTYRVERWLGKRGTGQLFAGVQLGANQPVVIKEYLLPRRYFNQEEAQQRQKAFTNLAGVTLADGRVQDSRVITPLEAIADTDSFERCYLVTDERDACPTLKTCLARMGAMPAVQVRVVLAQVLQTLELLHQQKFRLPSGSVQVGLVHGNLNLESLLWVEDGEEFFIYLCDLALWERIFDPPTTESPSNSIARDLVAVGYVGFYLLIGKADPDLDPSQDESWSTVVDLPLKEFILRLLGLAPPFESAESARQALLQLPQPTTASQLALQAEPEISEAKPVSRLLFLLLGVVGLGLVGSIIWALLPKPQPSASTPDEPQLCCLEEVSAVPSGQFAYTAVQGGTWSYAIGQRDVMQRGQTLEAKLRESQPNLELNYEPSESIEAAIAKVRAREVDFAIVPLLQPLPIDLAYREIAYDGLAVFVAFSYSKRDRGLPESLEGEASLSEVRQLYLGQIASWQELEAANLPVRLYAPTDPEAIQIFEQRVLKDLQMNRLTGNQVAQLPTLEMLRTILQDFESQEVGSIGFSPLSRIYGQCSIYPLAVKAEGQAAVQPLVLDNGQPIAPTTDLCDRKGSYHPHREAFQTEQYPLAYSLAVVYPRDNSLPPVGEKFAELLQTSQGQRLLHEIGLATTWQGEG